MADQADPPEGQLEDRVERLESGQTTMSGKIDEILGLIRGGAGKAHDAAADHEENRLDRPTTVEEQVRAELARADAERQAAADKDAEKSEMEQLKANVAALRETPPVPPQPKRERFMWGSR